MKWRESAMEYFSFSRRDRIAVLMLALLVLLVAVAPHFMNTNGYKSQEMLIDTTVLAALKPTPADRSDSEFSGIDGSYLPDRTLSPSKPRKRNLFYFDPNTLDDAGWERLGIRTKTVSTIRKYLSKGGRFYKPEDMARIYGISGETFAVLRPYIRITLTTAVVEHRAAGTNIRKPKEHSYPTVEINVADTSAFIALPGIGSKLASRIISFREKLGGFYSVKQVGETFGLADSSFQKLKKYLVVDPASIKKLNVNTASLETLKTHPYIRYAIANAIIAYRNEHGPFSKIDDIKNIQAIPEELFNKLLPYLSLE